MYAKWEPKVYNITYNLNGGTNSDNNPSTYTIEDNITLEDATKQGYVLAGWYDNDNNKVETIIGRTGNIMLTAHWTEALNNLSVTSEGTSK